MLAELEAEGYQLVWLHPNQVRINGVIDYYPIHAQYENIKSRARYRGTVRKDLKRFIKSAIRNYQNYMYEQNKHFEGILHHTEHATTFAVADPDMELDFDAVQHLIDQLPPVESEPVHHVKHNGCHGFFKQFENPNGAKTEPLVAALYGIPIFETLDIPYGQIHLCDKDGNIINQFIWTEAGGSP